MQSKTAREVFDGAMHLSAAKRTAWLTAQTIDDVLGQRLVAMISAEANANNPLDRPFFEQLAGLAVPESIDPSAASSKLIGTHI